MKALLCPLSDGGYLYPAIAVGLELRRRGHVVSAIGRASAAPVLAEAGLPFAAAEDFGVCGGFSATWWGKTGMAQYLAILRSARQVQADLLISSVLCPGAVLAAEVLDVPVVVIGLSVHLWEYQAGGADEPPFGRTRQDRTNLALEHYADLRAEACVRGSSRWPHYPLTGDALLLRGDPALEYPGAVLPDRVAHVGPLVWEPAADPAELAAIRSRLALTGKPVVYAHLGRFFGGTSRWPRLNAAFAKRSPFQAVVEQGRSTRPQPDPSAGIIVVSKPWMGPLIDLAGLVLTSGTSAPALAAMVRGRPLGVYPNGSEQPLLAAACVRAGVASYLFEEQSPDQIGPLAALWHDGEKRASAVVLGRRLVARHGPALAAEIAERVLAGRAWPEGRIDRPDIGGDTSSANRCITGVPGEECP